MRRAAPTNVGVEVSSSALLTATGLPWPSPARNGKPAAPMLVTTVPQMTQTLKPRFSANTEKARFFRAVRFVRLPVFEPASARVVREHRCARLPAGGCGCGGHRLPLDAS
ncbi:Uncharacterised protein [Mycobacteroides abscessus subsp. abscessus]|nr:Uncharacterised protein [Mycobacteroides abscessus subsp. abscessus]